MAGPRVPLSDLGAELARIDLTDLEVAAAVELRFELGVTFGGTTAIQSASIFVYPANRVAAQGPIGGATTAAAHFEHLGETWALFSTGAQLTAAKASTAPDPKHSIEVPGLALEAMIVPFAGKRFALLAMGTEGIGVVDVTDPAAMVMDRRIHVNYFQDGLTWAEGGGSILVDQEIQGLRGDVRALEVADDALYIANANYGVHRTALSHLLDPAGPTREPDGTLAIDHEVFTLQFAGENPWGGPLGMDLVGDRLFVAKEFLGLAILDSTSLESVGAYNMYTDVSVEEDWFLDLDVAQAVQPGFLDPVTGMPDYRQASYEIMNSHGSGSGSGGNPISTPWADFDRYGRYYYKSQDVDVVVNQRGAIAYMAYGLGGIVAVNVTDFELASTGAGFLNAQYLAFAPGVPAHGADEFIGAHNDNIYPHFGSGMLAEAGVIDVSVIGSRAFYTDHFAGLVVLDGADDPVGNWHGASAPYDNDNGTPGDHNPDYEFVTSYDMSPFDPTDHESLPAWMYEAPCALVTGEIGGHGNSLVLLPGMDIDTPGQVDALMCLGAGGLDYLDILDINAPDLADRLEVVRYFPTTDELGADPAGLPTQTIAIGHTQGLATTDEYLYVADGPHGISAWRIVDGSGYPTDDVHLVGNTVQDEYPVQVGDTTVYPATHAYGVVFDPVSESALTLCQGLGLRRVPVDRIEAGLGTPGEPILVSPNPEDIFEHKSDAGNVASVPKQDHTFDVALDGDLAYLADGGNGLTIYDLSKDPSDPDSGFFVGNLGGATQSRPELGRSTGIALWTNPSNGAKYAFMACGPYGVGIVDINDPAQPVLVKTFEPYKSEDDRVGKADGRCVDVFVEGSHAYFTYDGFGVLCFAIPELIEPVPDGIDPTKIWNVEGGTLQYDHRPLAVSEFRLREVPRLQLLGGGALNMTHTAINDELLVYVAYGDAGIVILNYSNPSAPVLDQVLPTPGECSAVALSGGRIFAADGAGGFVSFK